MHPKHKYLSVLLLFILSIAAFWQVFFLQKGLKWDVIDSFLPARYFVSESLRLGIIPLWNPYLYLGTPSFGDMVSVWNPEVWVVSLFTTYSNVTLQFIFIFYIFLSGVGMLKLLRFFKVNEYFAIAGGVTYMLSGLMIGNAQNLAVVAGAAWLSFVVLFYWKFLKNISWKTLLPLLFFLYLILFNGYPGLSIILMYLLGTFFVVELMTKIRLKDPLQKFFIYHFYLLFLLTAIASVLIISYFQVKPYIGQMAGISMDWALMHPFTLHSLITFFTPLAGIKNPEFFKTDMSMTNIYVGIITLVFFMVSLFLKKNRFVWIVSVFGLIALLASLGNVLPVRKYFFEFLPFMNVFRYPAIFRLFVIFPVVFSGFYFMETILTKKKVLLFSGLIVMFFLILYLLIKSYPEVNFETLKLFDNHLTFFEKLDKLSFKEVIFFQAIIQSVFIVITGIVLFFKKPTLWLTFLMIIDMLISVQLNAPFTVFSQEDPKVLAEKLETLPKVYPIPDARELIYNTDLSGQFPPVWRNTNLFQKRVSPFGFGSFIIKDFVFLTDSFPEFSQKIFHHPVVYFTNQIKPESELKKGLPTNKDNLYLKEVDFEKYKNQINTNSSLTDAKITSLAFSPVSMKFDVSNENFGFLCLLQNYFPMWNATIDGKNVPVIKANISLMSVPVTKGNHTVELTFSDTWIKYAFTFGMIVLIVCLLYYFLTVNEKLIARNRILIAAILLIVLLFSIRGKYIEGQILNGRYKIIGLAMKHLADKFPNNTFEGITEVNDTNALKNYCKNNNIDMPNHFIPLHFKYNWNKLCQVIDSAKSDYFFIANSYKPVYEELITRIRRKYPNEIYSIKAKDINFYCFSNQKSLNKDYILNVSNDMERYSEGWNNESKIMTNEKSFSWSQSALITKEQPYSPSYKFMVNNLDSGKTYLVTLSAQIFLSEDAKGSIICSVYDGSSNTNYFWQGEDLNPFFDKRNVWRYTSKTFEINNQFPSNLPLVLYIWNKDTPPIYVDDMNLVIHEKQ